MPGSKAHHNIIALRREDLNKKGEKRAAISPEAAAQLTAAGAKLWVQPRKHPETRKTKRVFPDASYRKAGAVVKEDIRKADLIVGLKEVNLDGIHPGKAYAFFSHTHKGQKKNRKMLRALVDGKCTLIDYELITNKDGARSLTAFTYHAGYAGMTDTLWVLGERLRRQGIRNPFEPIRQSQELQELAAIRGVLRGVGKEIERNGTPRELPPVINCVLGEGKTSTGAQHIYGMLPVEHITLQQLPEVFANGSRHKVYQLLLGIPEMFRLRPDVGNLHSVYRVWSRQDQIELYLSQPELFESNLDLVLPYVTLLTHCTLWSSRYPRVLSRALMEAAWAQGTPLQVIGDITCDPEGSVEFCKETWIDDPVYIYHPARKHSEMGMDGEGIAVMAVTNLPCELSADSSDQFSAELLPFLQALAHTRLEGSLEEAQLPEALARATILWKGEFTARFSYMQEFVEAEAPQEAMFPVAGIRME